MDDVLIPLGLLAFIGLFAFSLIHAARKQQRAAGTAFREFASRKRLRYQEEDDGTARAFARGFHGIGQFESASLGEVIPKDVVDGVVNGSKVVLFRHRIRYSEGWAREWYVAGVTLPGPVAGHCTVQFCTGRSQKNVMHLADPVVKEMRAGRFHMIVRAADPSAAGRMLEDAQLKRLARIAAAVTVRPEIQLRRDRLVVYIADRNVTVEDAGTLARLTDFAVSAAKM